GNTYAITSNGQLRDAIFLGRALGAAYTPVALDRQGRVFALNAGVLSVLGRQKNRARSPASSSIRSPPAAPGCDWKNASARPCTSGSAAVRHAATPRVSRSAYDDPASSWSARRIQPSGRSSPT